jgi:selenocysteine lyase/cysteine desulfurase
MFDSAALRAQFPVFERQAYLNAGTDGPLPSRAVQAAAESLEIQAREGRYRPHFERRFAELSRLRAAYASLLGCDDEDVAITTCTSDGMASVVSGLDLRAGDEILTSDEEHPGLIGALQAARDLRGVSVRMVPLAEIAEQVGPATRLVTCSHVGWVSGSFAPAALAELEVPVLLDGAQGIGAVPVDVRALGCEFYAGAGQKWLCGPDGLGMCYVAPHARELIGTSRRGFLAFENPEAGLDARLRPDARRFDGFAVPLEATALALASFAVLEEAGWSDVHARAAALAERLVERLAERGREVAARGRTTLVSFFSADPPAEAARLAQEGIIVRYLPGRPWLRASVGAWNDESDLERLLEALSPA